MLLLLQLLAFVAFPVDGVYGGYLDAPIYIEVIPDDGLMYDLRMDLPPPQCGLRNLVCGVGGSLLFD